MTESSSKSSVGEGNTITSPTNVKKQIPPSKRWCFTLNNYTEELVSAIVPVLEQNCKIGMVGKEIGEECGTPHLQGYVEFIKKCRPLSLFGNLCNKFHWEKCKGSRDENIVYCSKDGDVVWSKGIELKYIHNIELKNWMKSILKDIIEKEPDKRSLYWFWEPLGGVGKTDFQKYVFTHYENVVVVSGKGSDMKNNIVEFQKLNNSLPKVVLINIPRCNYDYVSWCGIEEIKDMFFYSGKYEGGMVCGRSPHVIIFANEEPPLEKMSNDRWKVIEIKTSNSVDNKVLPEWVQDDRGYWSWCCGSQQASNIIENEIYGNPDM